MFKYSICSYQLTKNPIKENALEYLTFVHQKKYIVLDFLSLKNLLIFKTDILAELLSLITHKKEIEGHHTLYYKLQIPIKKFYAFTVFRSEIHS